MHRYVTVVWYSLHNAANVFKYISVGNNVRGPWLHTGWIQQRSPPLRARTHQPNPNRRPTAKCGTDGYRHPKETNFGQLILPLVGNTP